METSSKQKQKRGEGRREKDDDDNEENASKVENKCKTPIKKLKYKLYGKLFK